MWGGGGGGLNKFLPLKEGLIREGAYHRGDLFERQAK